MVPSPRFTFGDFAWLCDRSSLTVCPALGLGDPQCYSRNIGIKDFLLFQPSVMAVDLSAMVMTVIMIAHIKSKYTAVGRKEMVIFFYIYMLCVALELALTTNIIPISATLYKYFAALHVGIMTSAFSVLLLNGFVGFQWAEDGTKLSVWTFRIAAIISAAAGFFISISTFLGFAGMGPNNTLVLYILMFIFNGAALSIYIVLQIFLVLNTLHDRWPLGDIFFGLTFFILGMMASLGFSNQICQFSVHYVDGLFLGSTFVLLSVMMVYKYWDSITSEDLEFSVPGGPQIWHLQNTMDLPLKPGIGVH